MRLAVRTIHQNLIMLANADGAEGIKCFILDRIPLDGVRRPARSGQEAKTHRHHILVATDICTCR